MRNMILIALLTTLTLAEYRTFDGKRNNVQKPSYGQAQTPYVRLQANASYADGVSSISGPDRPSPLQISNLVFKGQGRVVHNSLQLSDAVAYLGQFLAHDILLTGNDPNETFTIPLPPCLNDDEPCDGISQPITLKRAISPGLVNGVRGIVNAQSAFVDGSHIYGFNSTRAGQLRQKGFAYLKTQQNGQLLPAINGEAMDGRDVRRFVAGDPRANENPALQSLHTLFVREHNRKVDEFYLNKPTWDDEKVYQEARKWTVAVWQKIVYSEYLPLILGGPLPEYQGYNSTVDPGIDVVFMAASFRYGHSAINPLILRLNEDGSQHALGHLLLRDAFFNPRPIYQAGIEPILRGIMSQVDSEIDSVIIDDLRKYFVDQPFDLVAVNIMRGRDVGTASYNEARVALGLPLAQSWSDITQDQDVASLLQLAYDDDISKVDLYVGGLAEDHVDGSILGPVFWRSIREQFIRLRDGDRFWYENIKDSGFSQGEVAEINKVSLASLIKLNTDIKNGPPSAFVVPKASEFSWSGTTASSQASFGQATLTSGYDVKWNVSDSAVTFTLYANYSGFFGLGFSANGMVNADIVICSDKSGTFTCQDYYSSGQNPILDTVLGGTDDLVDVQDLTTTEVYHTRVMQFTKPRVSKDSQYDAQLTGSSVPIIFAYTNDASVQYHGPQNRGSAVLNLNQGSNSLINSDLLVTAKATYFVFHGLLMLLCFGVLSPLAIYIARHPALFENWLSWHKELLRTVVQAAVFDVIVVSISTFLQGNIYWQFTHAKIGFTLCGLLLLNFLLGHLSKAVDKLSLATSRQVRKSHQVLGWGIFVTGMLNCVLGLRDIGGTVDSNYICSWVFMLYSLNMLAFLLYYEKWVTPILARRLIRGKAGFNKSGSISGRKNIPKFDMEEAHFRIERGSHWIIMKDLIYDVEEFRSIHPGGHELLTQVYGVDSEAIFNGTESVQLLMDTRNEIGKEVKKIIPKRYTHSRLAASELTGYIVGQISNAFTSNVINNQIESSDRWVKCTLQSKRLVTPHKCLRPVYEFAFGFPDNKWTISFKPGDAVQLRVVFAGRICTRFYTPSKVEDNKLTLVIKIYEDGQFTNLLDKFPIGAEIYFRGPLNLTSDVLNPHTDSGCYEKLGMVCGGTGIVPMILAMEYYLEKQTDQEPREIRLVALFSSEDDLIDMDFIKSMVSKFQGKLKVHINYTHGSQKSNHVTEGNITSSRGLVSKELLQAHLPRNETVDAFQKVAKENPSEPLALVRKRMIKQSVDQLDADSKGVSRDVLKRQSPAIIAKSSLVGSEAEVAVVSNIKKEFSGTNFRNLLRSVRDVHEYELEEEPTNLKILVSGGGQFLIDIPEKLYALGYDVEQVAIYSNHQSLYRPASIHSTSRHSKHSKKSRSSRK